MLSKQISRRAFVKGSLSALAIASLPATTVFGQTTTRLRQEWREFRSSPNYSSFIDALRIMRANTDANSRSSWRYWTNVHVNYCPHSAPYFLAWHRGYIYYFERQLQIVSGNSNLALPYWDYYTYPTIPSEFTDPATGNPLYISGRVNTNVYSALSLSPFASTVWNFERGRPNAFEPLIESKPHNPVHNIIAGVMATMESPLDPIFYLHHANIDRLWHAWALPDGKGIPAATSPYWSGNFTYAPDLTLARSQCYHPLRLGTTYSNNNKPTSLPAQGMSARLIRVQAQIPGSGDTFPAVPPGPSGNDARKLGGGRKVTLAGSTVRVRIPVLSEDGQTLRGIAAAEAARGASRAVPSNAYKSVQVVLDDVRLLDAGMLGGFYYNVFLSVPERGEPSEPENFIGTIGPFEINSASHHGPARLTFPATQVLGNVAPGDIRTLAVTLVRVSGPNSPQAPTIEIGELRVEVSRKEPYDTSPLITKPAGEPYR
ncbi:tyrosinase family protein [Noviherbaspirillum denitrificans]|uniref:Tyrosinase copper-binding domain-containing protein n=1 Tax=Noviherbaspirillum denitrificans TaxID=1968433 RepID=A0A254T7E5_9BURK|nr:tyrosinase family protein [Noviherbaspirillum denitrificans]OWW18576.1 hypothetical protein AYR66_00765 [Noviherbaspirillum denitrificans]